MLFSEGTLVAHSRFGQSQSGSTILFHCKKKLPPFIHLMLFLSHHFTWHFLIAWRDAGCQWNWLLEGAPVQQQHWTQYATESGWQVTVMAGGWTLEDTVSQNWIGETGANHQSPRKEYGTNRGLGQTCNQCFTLKTEVRRSVLLCFLSYFEKKAIF